MFVFYFIPLALSDAESREMFPADMSGSIMRETRFGLDREVESTFVTIVMEELTVGRGRTAGVSLALVSRTTGLRAR